MPMTFRPRFDFVREHCPANPAEEHFCVGRLAIYAYLEASGTVDLPSPHPTAASTTTTYQITGKILPQKVTIPFAVDFSDSFGKDTVKTCMDPVGECAPTRPQEFLNEMAPGALGAAGLIAKLTIEHVGVPTASTREQNDCVMGKAKFTWQAGVLTGQAVLNANLITSNIPLVGVTSVGGGAALGVALGGVPIPPLEVSFEICYREGCWIQTLPRPTGTDAEAVYANPTGLKATP